MLRNMKKFNIVLIALLLMLSMALIACSKASDETETGEAADSSQTDETDELYDALDADQELIDAVVPVRPADIGTVTTLNYKGLSFETPAQQEITDFDIREYLEDNILTYVTNEVTEGEVEDGDTVNIDYVGTLDGEAFDGGSYEGYDLVIGSGTFIEGFEDGLIGAKIGETRVLTLTFPEEYSNTDLAGQETEFTVTVNSISRPMSFEEFDDEAADELSDGIYPTRDEYLTALEEYLRLSADINFLNDLYNNAVFAALEASEVSVTDEAVEWQLDVTTSNYELTVEQWGINLSYYLYLMGIDYESFREMMRDSAEEGAKEVLLVFAVCDEEGLTADDDAIAEYAGIYGYEDEDIRDYLDEDNLEIAVKWFLAGRAITETADVTYTEVEDEDSDS